MKKIVQGQIRVVGKRWFQKSAGNTYHSVTIYVNDEVLRKDFTYGYDDHYKQTAHSVLLENNYDVAEDYISFLHMDNLSFEVSNVSKKKDL